MKCRNIWKIAHKSTGVALRGNSKNICVIDRKRARATWGKICNGHGGLTCFLGRLESMRKEAGR